MGQQLRVATSSPGEKRPIGGLWWVGNVSSGVHSLGVTDEKMELAGDRIRLKTKTNFEQPVN